MSLAQFLRILLARRLIIVGVMAVCIVISLAVIVFLPPRYPATARVLMDVIKPDPVSGAVISSGFVRGYTKTQTELITDYRVAGDVVDKLNMAADPKRVADYTKNTNGTEDFRRYEARQIIDKTSADLLSGSNILEISYYTDDPLVAKKVVTALRDSYLDAALRFRTDAAGRSADWYVGQAAKAQRELAAAEAKKSAFEQSKGIVMSPGGADSETMKLESMQNALTAAQSAAGMSEATTDHVSPASSMVDQLKVQLNGIDDQISQASERLGTSHPTYIALVQRRAVVQAQLAKETALAHTTGGSSTAAARANVGRLDGEYRAQKAKVLGLKGDLDALAQLQREVELRRSQYEKAAARTADLKLEADVSENGLIPLGDAVVSGTPSFPNVPLILALGVMVGLAFGVVAGIAAEMLKRRVRGPEDLARASKVPVLAVIADAADPAGSWLRRLLRRPGSSRAEWQPAQ
ncbi:MAG: GumC family protein [Janthinobacterium lividum]